MKTIHDIAALAGCSARTVSRVFNQSGPVAEKTRQKILSLAEEHHFKPNSQARNLRMGQKKCIGIVQSSADSEVHRHRIDTMTGLFSSSDYALLINRARNEQHEIELVQRMTPQCDALIVFTSLNQSAHPVLDQLQKNAYPFFIVDPAQGMPYPSIYIDRIQGYRQGTLALAEQGRKRIALVTQDFRRNERVQGYKDGLQLADIPFKENLVLHCEKSFEGGKLMGSKIAPQIRAGDIDGILCHNDRIALGLIGQLQKAQLQIPKDVSIIGFDNDAFGSYTTPSLSTVEQGRQEVGVTIYEQVHARLEQGLSLQNCRFSTRLIVRESI